VSDNEELTPGISPGGWGVGPPIEAAESTPLDDEDDGAVPAAPLWAMKDRLHFHLLPEHRGSKRIRACLGVGDSAVYVIDDGHLHCMIGHRVGSSPDGCTYCLVGRITTEQYHQFASGQRPTNEMFGEAHDISLMAVYEDRQDVSNVFTVRHFAHLDDVPTEYLPPNPFIAFPEDLSADQ
jgi:hypothetical protein